jgi:hypothetical protein
MKFQAGTGSVSWAWNRAWYVRTKLARRAGLEAFYLIQKINKLIKKCNSNEEKPEASGKIKIDNFFIKKYSSKLIILNLIFQFYSVFLSSRTLRPVPP